MKRVVFIGAHPDDIEIGCAGTEVLLRERGYSLIHIVVTSGEEGTLGDGWALAQRREAEARASAHVLGVEEVHFLRAPDGLTSFSKELKLEVMKFLRHYRPQIVFTHSSEDHFPDHRVVHGLTMAAVEGIRGPWYPEAAGNAHSVESIYGYEVWHPMNRFQMAIPLGNALQTKLKAFAKHESQTSAVDYCAAVQALACYRGVMTLSAGPAEVFEVLQSSASSLLGL